MNEVYRSLKLRVQDSLQRAKANSTRLPSQVEGSNEGKANSTLQVEGTTPLSLHNEIDGLENLVADSIGKLKAAVNEREAMVSEEIRQADQLAVSLKADVAKLSAKLKETEETVEAVVTTWTRDGLDRVRALGVEGVELRHLPMILAPALTAGQLAALRDDPAVRSISANEPLKLYMEDTTWSLGARDAWGEYDADGLDQTGFTGAGVEVAVIDTGADGRHADFGNLVEFCETRQALTGDRSTTRLARGGSKDPPSIRLGREVHTVQHREEPAADAVRPAAAVHHIPADRVIAVGVGHRVDEERPARRRADDRLFLHPCERTAIETDGLAASCGRRLQPRGSAIDLVSSLKYRRRKISRFTAALILPMIVTRGP